MNGDPVESDKYSETKVGAFERVAIFPRCSLISECWAGGGACSWLSGDRPAGAAPCAVQGKAGRPSPRVGDRRAEGGGLPQSVSGPISPWDAGLAAHSQLWGH